MKTEWLRIDSRWLKSGLFRLFLLLIIGGCNYILPNKPPYVERTSPVDNAVYTIGSLVPFTVTAYDVDGSVSQVVFTAPGATGFIDNQAPYEFSWTTAGMQEGAYQVEIKAIDNDDEPYIIKVPVRLIGSPLAQAGRDTIIYTRETSYVLQAETTASGTGTWSIITGTGGSIAEIHNANSLFSGNSCQTYILRWTVNNSVNQVSDDVMIQFMHRPSMAFAGPDQAISDGKTVATLAAGDPSEGIGLWKIVSGGVGTFSDNSLPYAEFTGQACSSYKLVWTVSTACEESSDTVAIVFEQFAIVANAGPDQFSLDGRTTAILAGNTPSNGTGTWTIVSGSNGQVSDVNNPAATFSGEICQTYILQWTISTSCGARSDDVVITFDHIPTEANAGPDIHLSGTIRSMNLAGNAPVQGTGEWTIVSGTGGILNNANDPTTEFTGEACQTYLLKWTISTPCDVSSDQMTVIIIDLPSEANAGPDQHLVDGSTMSELNANVPVNGAGRWSIISGGDGSFSNPVDPHTTFSGSLCHSYILRWTISTPCNSKYDEMTIVFNQLIIQADAGEDQRLTNGSTTTALQANDPGQGLTGTWSVLVGVGGTFANLNDPTTVFTGQLGQVYKLKWSISTTCAENSDEVLIAFLSNQILYDARDGRSYLAVGIGTQVWMAENLSFEAPAGSYAYGNSIENTTVYGRLYTWASASTACPSGWHLPSDTEWRQLEQVLGMDESTTYFEWYRGNLEGGMLKETGLSHWLSPNSGATNISGISARPGGYRTTSGIFGGLNTHAGFWTTTIDDGGKKAMYRALHKDKAQSGRDWSELGYGFSVRCVKN